MKITRSSFNQIISFLVNPFIGFLSSLYYLRKINTQVNLYIFALSLGLIFIYFPIMYDTSVNFYYTESAIYQNINFDIWHLYQKVYVYTSKFLTYSFMSLIYFYIVIILFIWTKIFEHYKNMASTKAQVSAMFLFFIFSILYRNIMDLNRFSLAASLSLFVLYLININKEKINYKAAFLAILSIFIHPAVIVVYFIYVISISIKSIKIYQIIFVTSLGIGFLGQSIIDMFSSHLSVFAVFEKADNYTRTGYAFGTGSMNIDQIIIRGIQIPLTILIFFKGIDLLKNKDTSLNIRVTLLLASVSVALMSFITLYERYTIVFLLFSTFIMYRSLLSFKLDKVLKLILLLFFLRFILFNFVVYGRIFTSYYNPVLPDESKKIEMVLKPFYMPTILLLNINNYGYSNAYIQAESQRGKDVIFYFRD